MIIVTDIPLQFQCFKAYEEDTYYTNGAHVVIFRTLYHFATLSYDVGSEIPQKSVDGNYYKIPEPSKSECGDVFAEKTEIQIQDLVLKSQVEAILRDIDPLEWDEYFVKLGFKISSRQIMYGLGTAMIGTKNSSESQIIQGDASSSSGTDMPLWLIS